MSIDGGGMRGMIPAVMMNLLCECNKKEIWELFDCIGGSSIGGIIALGSSGTIDGINPVADHNEIVKIFEEHGS